MREITIPMNSNLDATVIASTINHPVEKVRATVLHDGEQWVVVLRYHTSGEKANEDV